MEAYWSFELFTVTESSNIGSSSNTLIISKIPALANGERELFEEDLQFENKMKFIKVPRRNDMIFEKFRRLIFYFHLKILSFCYSCNFLKFL